MKTISSIQYFRLPGVVLLVFLTVLYNGSQAQKTGLPRDVIPGYKGWDGNPDSLKVYIDPSFDSTQKVQIRNAMKHWNDAGGKPVFKESSDSDSPLKVKKGNPGAGAEGVYKGKRNPATGKRTDGEIIVKTAPDTPGLSFEELVTHELGHALGLDDTDQSANPSDVMKGKGTNGSGGLSQHDSTELKAAGASITAISTPEPEKKKAFSPAMAITPGTPACLGFYLDDLYPPETVYAASSPEDPLLTVSNIFVDQQTLWIWVIPHAEHGSGSFYLNVEILPPPPMEPESFIGYFYTHVQPVEPCVFDCPVQIIQTPEGEVHIHWIDSHTYPHVTQPLRAKLWVNGDEEYLTRGEYFALDLPAGDHLIQLFVDDHQVNFCSSSITFTLHDILPRGSILFSVPCADISFDPSGDLQPVPANFFHPGSEPFSGTIKLAGKNSEGSMLPFFDISVQFPDVVFSPPYPVSATVPVELTSMNLTGTEPIQVIQNGTWTADSFFDVFVELAVPGTGNMILEKFDPVNGTFDLELPVQPRFIFKNAVKPDETLVYEPPDILLFSSTIPMSWIHSPGGFEPDPNQLTGLQTPSGSGISLVPLPARDDQFTMEMDENGQVIGFEGSGYNHGQWYYYPNTNWWNVWFYDHRKDVSRKKIVNSTITIQPRLPDLPSYVEIVLNWSTPSWPGFPETDRPPLPSDVPDIETENLYITRSESFYNGQLTEATTISIDNFIIENFNPEWLSIDVRGSNFIISGNIHHICFKESSCPRGHRMPSDFGIMAGDWLIAEPWHQWIDPRESTRIQLHAFDPTASISQVTFFHNIDNTGWLPFFTDTDGESGSRPGEIPFAPGADGWSGYFSLLGLEANATALFAAEVSLVTGEYVWVESETGVELDITPPSSFETNISDFMIIEGETLLLDIFPVDANIVQVGIESEKKKEEFKKGIPPLGQHGAWRRYGGDQHCSPTSAAACLKYFADSTGDASIMGDLTPQQLVDLLAVLMRTNMWRNGLKGFGKGTLDGDIVRGLEKWIKHKGENYTVRLIDYNWETMRNELERCQDVLTNFSWHPLPNSGGHTMTFNSIVNRPLANGKIKVDFMDPLTGDIQYGELDTETGIMMEYGTNNQTATIDNMVIVCPKETEPISPASEKTVTAPGSIPPQTSITLPEPGLYWIRIEVLDADGNKARKDVIVERVTTGLHLQDVIITANDPPVCEDKYAVISTGGNGSVFIAETGSSVTLAASEVVKLLDGTHFQPGSVAHILIYDGDYCNPPSKGSLVSAENHITGSDDNENSQAADAFFSVYPSPTTGRFTLAVNELDESSSIRVEIINLFGRSITRQELLPQRNYLIDISGQPSGLYTIRVTNGNKTGIKKLIKH